MLEEVSESRVVRDLFAHQGALRGRTEQPEGERTIIPEFISKGVFTSPPRVLGLTSTARMFGRQARRSESEALARALEEIKAEPFEDDSPLAYAGRSTRWAKASIPQPSIDPEKLASARSARPRALGPTRSN